jgi:hypothetical protein
VGATSILRQKEVPDWATEALNSPVGSMAQALMEDPELKDLKRNVGFPVWWTSHAEELLLLPGQLRRHALPIFTHNLVWLFAIDPRWTNQHFLPFCEKSDEDSSAFWAGFFWGAKIPQDKLYLQMKPALLHLASDETIDRRQYVSVLAGIILAGWGGKKNDAGERIITDDELRSLLLAADDEFRTQVIWQLERWSQEADSHWRTEALVLLRRAWPRQIIAKTPRVSARLCELAFAMEDEFPAYVDAILPLVTKVVGDEVTLPILRHSRNTIIERFPAKALALLNEVLPDNVRRWPYGIDDVLTRIGNSDSTLLLDFRLIELNRKWAAR